MTAKRDFFALLLVSLVAVAYYGALATGAASLWVLFSALAAVLWVLGSLLCAELILEWAENRKRNRIRNNRTEDKMLPKSLEESIVGKACALSEELMRHDLTEVELRGVATLTHDNTCLKVPYRINYEADTPYISNETDNGRTADEGSN
jgi:hypothetical protein